MNRAKSKRISISLIFGFILIFPIYGLVTAMYGHINSLSWIKHEAIIKRIINKQESATVFYSYTYHGSSYTGDKLAYLSDGSKFDKEYITKNFRERQNINIFINPNLPEQSVILKREFKFEYIFIYLIVIVGVSIVGFINYKKSRPNRSFY